MVTRLSQAAGLRSCLCVTAQHREMLDQVLLLFNLTPDYDLALMTPGQDLADLTAAAVTGVQKVIRAERPDRVLVQGDTTTTFAAALAAFYERVPVGHVEAGLRTGDLNQPWPEEMNRRLTTNLADLHFAPTTSARDNLLRELVPGDRILVTGNTVIDALFEASGKLDNDPALEAEMAQRFGFLAPALAQGRRIILTTGHRRESFNGGLERVCQALARIAERADVCVVYPVHLNPKVQAAANKVLAGRPNVHLIEPQDYLPFVYLMRASHLIVTDSGGIQEEAPSLGKPVLVTRETTERPEAVDAGTVRLVGTDSDALVKEITRLLDDAGHYETMQRAHNPYGDGQAADRIVQRLAQEPDK